MINRIIIFLVVLALFSCKGDMEKQKLLRELSSNERTEFGIILNALNKIKDLSVRGDHFLEAIPKIIYLTGSENSRIRQAAFLTLEAYGEIILSDLANNLRSNNDFVKNACLQLLIKIGRPALPTMRNILKDADSFTKLSIINILGEIGDKSIIVDLASYLSSNDVNLIIVSAKALGNLKATEVTGKLLELLDHQNEHVKVASILALREIGTSDIADLIVSKLKPDDSAEFLLAALKTIEKIGEGKFSTLWVTRTLNPIFRYATADVRVIAESAYIMKLSGYSAGMQELEKMLIAREYLEYPVYIAYFLDVFKKAGKDAGAEKAILELIKRFQNPYIIAKSYAVLYHFGKKEYKDRILKLHTVNDNRALVEVMDISEEYGFSEICPYLPDIIKRPVFDVMFKAIETGAFFQCESIIDWMNENLSREDVAFEIKEKIIMEIPKYPKEISRRLLKKAGEDADPYIKFLAETKLSEL